MPIYAKNIFVSSYWQSFSICLYLYSSRHLISLLVAKTQSFAAWGMWQLPHFYTFTCGSYHTFTFYTSSCASTFYTSRFTPPRASYASKQRFEGEIKHTPQHAHGCPPRLVLSIGTVDRDIGRFFHLIQLRLDTHGHVPCPLGAEGPPKPPEGKVEAVVHRMEPPTRHQPLQYFLEDPPRVRAGCHPINKESPREGAWSEHSFPVHKARAQHCRRFQRFQRFLSASLHKHQIPYTNLLRFHHHRVLQLQPPLPSGSIGLILRSLVDVVVLTQLQRVPTCSVQTDELGRRGLILVVENEEGREGRDPGGGVRDAH
mmetsp:Transcript_11322/g.13378  ORF Transcript_11322/g.13378 Transcript_11322/m.13378 type:complete len:314 (+) Transcript_11322:379-1320(+)